MSPSIRSIKRDVAGSLKTSLSLWSSVKLISGCAMA